MEDNEEKQESKIVITTLQRRFLQVVGAYSEQWPLLEELKKEMDVIIDGNIAWIPCLSDQELAEIGQKLNYKICKVYIKKDRASVITSYEDLESSQMGFRDVVTGKGSFTNIYPNWAKMIADGLETRSFPYAIPEDNILSKKLNQMGDEENYIPLELPETMIKEYKDAVEKFDIWPDTDFSFRGYDFVEDSIVYLKNFQMYCYNNIYLKEFKKYQIFLFEVGE